MELPRNLTVCYRITINVQTIIELYGARLRKLLNCQKDPESILHFSHGGYDSQNQLINSHISCSIATISHSKFFSNIKVKILQHAPQKKNMLHASRRQNHRLPKDVIQHENKQPNHQINHTPFNYIHFHPFTYTPFYIFLPRLAWFQSTVAGDCNV